MRETDMELQVIRQKLESLKVGPTPYEAVELPWASSSLDHSKTSSKRTEASSTTGDYPYPSAQSARGTPSGSTPGPNPAQVAAAIETLKQRSNPSGYLPSSQRQQTPDQTQTPEALIAHEVQRFDMQVAKVNALAQQQATAILSLKDLAENLEEALKTFGIESHPDLDAIATFFADYDAASVTSIGCDQQGYYTLTANKVDFYQAERDAAATAESLRTRSQGSYALPPQETIGFIEEFVEFARDLGLKLGQELKQRFWPQSSQPANYSTHQRRSRPRFTLFDAAIWFSGAAIGRVLLNLVVNIYPGLWTPLMVGLICVVAIALYKTVLTSRPSVGLSYRILITLAGLFMGGQFL